MAFAFLLGFTASLVLASFYVYRKFYCHTYFKKLGIPGPEPHWLYGNLHQFYATDDRRMVVHNWSKQYGKYFGYYEGAVPFLCISDPEAVEDLCIKQFSSFPGRKNLAFHPDHRKYPDSPFTTVSSTWGDYWKRLRTIVNPGFSTGRLKAYSPLINKSQKELMKVFDQLATSKQAFDANDEFQYLTLDVISEVAFGIELNSIANRGSNNPILIALRKLMNDFAGDQKPAIKLTWVLPEVAPIFHALMVRAMKNQTGLFAALMSLYDVSAQVVDQRLRDSSLRRDDLLQMLIDAMDEKRVAGKAFKPLTKMEVVSQTIQFFQAGTNTTRISLSFASYCLAANPDCQERLYREIMANFPNLDVDPDYDTVMKMEYMDWFIHEVMRLFPMALFIMTRFAGESTELKGIPTKVNTGVRIDTWSLHQDQDLWGPVDPAKFHPERFSPDYPTTANRPSSAFLGFGLGPRVCLGMRLAMYEMKLTLVNILRRFEVIPPVEGYPKEGLAVTVTLPMLPRDGVWIRLVHRSSP